MEITQQQAYEAALSIIGRMTVEQHFERGVLQAQAAEIQRLTEDDGDSS